ncbi:hypothetical protein GCM10027347_34110 [Larkinella harenae]
MKTVLYKLLVAFSLTVELPAQPEPAQLILYREKTFIWELGTAYPFKINDQKVGKLSSKRYVQLPLMPGRVKIEFYGDYFSNSRPLWLQVQPGQTYYVKAVVDVDFLTATLLMVPVSPQQARQEIKRMKPENMTRPTD